MYAWSSAFVLPYESTWSLFQKFTWFHGTKPLVLLRDISPWRINVHDSSIVGEGQWCSFVDTCWMRYRRPRTASLPPVSEAGLAIHDELFQHGGQIYFGSLAKRVLTTSLKICPTCIGEGYHCIAHQIAGLRRCPLHDEELTSRCPLCGKYLGAFALSGMFHSFLCPTCGRSLLKEDFVPRLVTFADSILGSIKPLIAWINSFSNKSIAWPFVYSDPRMHIIGGTPESATLSRGLLHCFNRLKPFDYAQAWFSSEIAGLSLSHVHHTDSLIRRGARGHDLPRRDMQRREDETFACMEDVIYDVRMSLVEKMGVHDLCCEQMNQLLSPYAKNLEMHFVSPGVDYCGLAQAFDLWMRHLKAGLKYMKEDIRGGWWPRLDEAFREIARRDVTSSFYLGAKVIADYQNHKSVSHNQRYVAFDLRTRPLFSLNGECALCEHDLPANAGLLVFSFHDEAILDQLRCDNGRMIEEQVRRTVAVVNAVRRSVAEQPPMKVRKNEPKRPHKSPMRKGR